MHAAIGAFSAFYIAVSLSCKYTNRNVFVIVM